MSKTRKLAAILVTDVVGYSRLAGADEDRILARLRALRSEARRAERTPPPDSMDLYFQGMAWFNKGRNAASRCTNAAANWNILRGPAYAGPPQDEVVASSLKRARRRRRIGSIRGLDPRNLRTRFL